MTTQQIADVATDRNDTIAAIKAALKARSRKTWSVTGGRGTAWGWIRIIAPPARRGEFGSMTDADIAELSALFGETVHHQGISIPASSAHRREYLERAIGQTPTDIAQPYWD